MRRTLYLILFSCLLQNAVAQKIDNGVSLELARYRQKAISNLSYQLSFNIAAEVTGHEVIRFDLADAVEALQIDFKQVKGVMVNGREVAVNVQQEHIVIAAMKGRNEVVIDFIAGNASLNRNADYLYALFVPDRARTVFPCFDQPSLKAVFTLALTVPKGWQVLANAGVKDSVLADSNVTFHFKPSDKIPTYLFSFTAGKYTVVNKFGMEFLYRETDTAKIRLSLDSVFQAHKDAIRFLEDWTGIRFPFQKVGFAAIPSFQFGGMEHPGAVWYNSGGLFLDAGATKDQLIARSNVISHETAHMWFGDMVTMEWFNDVWMKEVFANFMADKVTEQLMGSETFNLKFLQDHYPAAYSIDRTPGANPIRQPLENLQDAGSLYGNIIYHKAPIMMRQLELLMGKPNFRLGVREYLLKYAYSNATWDDLIGILQQHTKIDLLQWNRAWVYEPGRPVFDYTLQGNRLVITSDRLLPQQFQVTVDGKVIDVNMQSKKLVLAVAHPKNIVFNTNGVGYGLFPVMLSNTGSPIQRASNYVNAYENMLDGRRIKPDSLLSFFIEGTSVETNEMNLRLMAGYMTGIYWQFIDPAKRKIFSKKLEEILWAAMEQQTVPNNKKILFKAYQDIYLGAEAAQRMYNIWQQQKPPAGVKLTEDDYTALALTIAVKNDTAASVLPTQLGRITNPDRKDRLTFLLPALSPDPAVRDQFFESLADPAKRRKEAWVAAALAMMNHPLRQQSFVKYLPKALDMLENIRRTGDIFFPQNWLGAIFSNYQSREAWQMVERFLNRHPNYNPRLKAKILQATDNLHRAAEMLY